MESEKNTKLNQNDETKENFQRLNYANFTNSLIEITTLLKDASIAHVGGDLDNDSKLHRSHNKLRAMCDELKHGFTMNKEYDDGMIIKKIYKTLTQYYDKIYPNPTLDLFSMKNEDGKTITIIPGIDAQLVTHMLSEEELKILWSHLYMMYIATIEMIIVVNVDKKNTKLYQKIGLLRKKVVELGVIKKDLSFNPFVGVGLDAKSYDIENMFANIEATTPASGLGGASAISSILKMAGIDKAINIDQINDQMTDINEDDIATATNMITNMFGTTKDSNVGDVCSTLVTEFISDFKKDQSANPLDKFCNTAQSIIAKLESNQIDRNKMKETMSHLGTFMENADKTMQESTSDPAMAEAMKGPMAMLQALQQGKQGTTGGKGQFNIGDIMGLLSKNAGPSIFPPGMDPSTVIAQQQQKQGKKK